MSAASTPTEAPAEQATSALPEAFASRLPFLFARAGNDVQVFAEPGLAALKLTGRGYTALAILEEERPGSQLELARACGKTPAATVAMIDELADAGYVTRERDPADRRRSIVTITPAGRKALVAADRLADEVQAKLLGALSRDEQDQLHDLLRRALLAVEPAGFVD